MENETSIQSEFRRVADEILAKPLPPLAATMRRLVGSEADFGKVVSSGWKLLHAHADRGSIGQWMGSVWFEKEIVRDGTIWLFHLATSLPFESKEGTRNIVPSGEPLREVFRGARTASVFLRDLRVIERKEGQIEAAQAIGTVAEPVLSEVEAGLVAALRRPAPSFMDDFKFQSSIVPLPDMELSPDAEFYIRLKTLADVAGRESRRECAASVFRLMIPLVDALKTPADSETQTLLANVSDLRLVGRFVEAAATCRKLHPEIERSLGAWALSIMADVQEEALEPADWRLAVRAGQAAEAHHIAIVAADRNLAESQTAEGVSLLARSIRSYFKLTPTALDETPHGLPDVIAAMMRHEDALAESAAWPKGGFWLLLALAMRLNGSAPDGVKSTLDRGLADSGINESKHKARDFPLFWQTEPIAMGDSKGWYVRRQLRAFPIPLLDSGERGQWIIPTRLGRSPGVKMLFRGLGVDSEEKFNALLDKAENNGAPWKLGDHRVDGEPDDPEVWRLHPLQEPDTGTDVWFRESRWYEPGKEIGFVVTKGAPTREGPYRVRGFYPIVERGPERTTVVTTWHWYPYETNGGGEALIRLPDGRPFRAVVSMFAGDRQTIERGFPRPCQLCGFGFSVRRRTDRLEDNVPKALLESGFVETTSRYMRPLNPESSASYWFSGRVESVASAGVAGCEDIVRLTVDSSLPFPLPIYVPQAELPEGIQNGDELCGFTTLVVDYYQCPDELAAEFARTNPDGPGTEPVFEPSCVTGQPRPVIETLPKRDPKFPERIRRPGSFNNGALAAFWLEKRYGVDNVAQWPASPRCSSFVIRRDGHEEARTLVSLTGADTPIPFDTLPDWSPLLVIRFIDEGDNWRVRYEEIPARSTEPAMDGNRVEG